MENYIKQTFDDYQIYSQLMMASRAFNEYIETLSLIASVRQLEVNCSTKILDPNTKDPEAENWIENWLKYNVTKASEAWKQGVSKFFIRLLVNYPEAFKDDNPEEGYEFVS